MKKKPIYLFILLLTIIFTGWNIISHSFRTTKAVALPQLTVSPHTIDLEMIPSNLQMNLNETRTIQVKLRPRSFMQDTLYGYELNLVASGAIEFVDIGPPRGLNNAPLEVLPFPSMIGTKFANVRYLFNKPNSTDFPEEVTFDVQVTKTSSQTACILTIDPYSSTIYGYNPVSGHSDFNWGTITDASCVLLVSPVPTTPMPSLFPTPSLSPTPNPSIILTRIPSPARVAGCQQLPAPQNVAPSGTIYVTAAGQKISWDAVPGARYYGIEIWQESIVKDAQGNDVIKYTKIFTTSTEQTSYIYEKFAQDTNYIIKVSAIDSCNNAWAQTESYISVLGTAPTNSPTPVMFPSATPTIAIPPMTIKMRLRFQGIYTKPSRSPKSPQVFLVWVRNADRENPFYKWVTAKYDQTGSWFISDTWNLVPSDGYKVWIKGEKHLQRKICDGRPSDQESGFYHCANDNGNIVLTPGDNYLDFSNVILFAGDIPFKGEGDGVLDAFDLAYIATNFQDSVSGGAVFSQAQNDLADLNYDGIIDSQDYTLGISAIRIQKYDETYPYKIHPFFRNVPLHPQFP